MSVYPDDKQHGSNNNDTDNDDIYRQSIKHVSSGAMPLRSITESEATIANGLKQSRTLLTAESLVFRWNLEVKCRAWEENG
jgi:hypothetical protein